ARDVVGKSLPAIHGRMRSLMALFAKSVTASPIAPEQRARIQPPERAKVEHTLGIDRELFQDRVASAGALCGAELNFVRRYSGVPRTTFLRCIQRARSRTATP